MKFRTRLALFLIVALLALQALTAGLVYQAAKGQLVREDGRRLGVEANAFARRVEDIAGQVAGSVQVLSLDYALRGAVAQADRPTLRSVLRNHGRRVGATRLWLLDLDGRVVVDTAVPGATSREGRPFPFRTLYEATIEKASPSASTVALDGRPYSVVVVPMFTPTLTSLVVALVPIDDALLRHLQQQGLVPAEAELLVQVGPEWRAATGGAGPASLLARLGQPPPFAKPVLVATAASGELVAYARRLDGPPESAPVAVLLAHSLSAALAPYRPVLWILLGVLALGLLAGVYGAMWLARSLSQPLETLAETARRIAGGDFTPPPRLPRRDELGALSRAIGDMAVSLAEREARIRYQAEHDSVTGLANRRTLGERIDAALGGAAGPRGALLMVGIGRLAEIVKTVGQPIADAVMQDAARRLAALHGPESLVAHGRAGDTAFLVWRPGLDEATARAQAGAIVECLYAPHQQTDLLVDLGPAVGIALAPEHGRSASALIQAADVALSLALAASEPLCFYDAVRDPHRPQRLSLMSELREALGREELRLYYQPKLSLARGRIESVEALVRWPHPTRGFIPPDEFIGLAEETGNIRFLTRWVLATAVAQLRAWDDKGWRIDIAVNVSARDLGDTALPERLAELLATHGVAPGQLIVEVTESAVMADPRASEQVLHALRAAGHRIAIDDFGVGQSSFAYLNRLPASELKIDRSFIQHLASRPADARLAGSMIELGHQLGHAVTAEGVEDAESRLALGRLGCDYIQGYHLSPALGAAAFEQWVAASAWPVRDQESERGHGDGAGAVDTRPQGQYSLGNMA